MKKLKILLAMTLCALTVAFTACGAAQQSVLSGVDVGEAASTLYVSLSFNDTLAPLSPEVVAASYSFASSSQTAVYVGSGSTAEEIIVCLASSEDSVDSLMSELKNYRKKRIELYKTYAAEQVPLLEAATIESSGLYVFYIASPDADAAQSVLSDYINGKL